PISSSWGGAAIVLSAASISAPCTYSAAFGGVEGSGSSTLSTNAFQTTTGKTIIVAVGIGGGNDPATVITSVTDTAGGNTYTAIPGAYVKSGNSGIQFYICSNANGSATNVISANLTGSNTYSGIWAWEVSNAGSVDTTATGTGTNTSPTTGSFTPGTNELVLVACHQYAANQGFTPGSGYNGDLYINTAVSPVP